jgi:hypothetical protein
MNLTEEPEVTQWPERSFFLRFDASVYAAAKPDYQTHH